MGNEILEITVGTYNHGNRVSEKGTGENHKTFLRFYNYKLASRTRTRKTNQQKTNNKNNKRSIFFQIRGPKLIQKWYQNWNQNLSKIGPSQRILVVSTKTDENVTPKMGSHIGPTSIPKRDQKFFVSWRLESFFDGSLI